MADRACAGAESAVVDVAISIDATVNVRTQEAAEVQNESLLISPSVLTVSDRVVDSIIISIIVVDNTIDGS